MKKSILLLAFTCLSIAGFSQTVKSGNRVIKLNAADLGFIRSFKCRIINEFLDHNPVFNLVNNDLAGMIICLYDKKPHFKNMPFLIAKGKI